MINQVFSFRRTNPKINKILEESLAEDVNIYRMKKVRVNAQVKAMVSLIESIFNVTYVIIVLFNVRTSFGSLMISAMLYLIILPYVSLMNTSYNKDRIIEDGKQYDKHISHIKDRLN